MCDDMQIKKSARIAKREEKKNYSELVKGGIYTFVIGGDAVVVVVVVTGIREYEYEYECEYDFISWKQRQQAERVKRGKQNT